MKKIYYITFSLLTSLSAAWAQNCPAPLAGEKLEHHYIEYLTVTSWATDVALVMSQYGTPFEATTPAPPTDVATTLSSLTYSVDDIQPSKDPGDCQDSLVYYVSFYKYPSTNCAYAETDVIFGVKAFLVDNAHPGPDCKGKFGNWLHSYHIDSSLSLPTLLLNQLN